MVRRSHRKGKDMPEPKPIRFGILGCGTAAIPVCEAITVSSFAELAAVYDVNQDLANDIGQRFHVRVTGTLEELLNDTIVDAIYIAVPHYLLAPLTQQVLEAGKHALTEKPLGISLDEVDRLIQLATQKELALGVFYEMRYAPAHAIARDFLEAGAIGTVIGVHIQTLIDKSLTYWQSGYAGRTINPWRGIKSQAGGGVVLMNTSHLLDALFHITGLSITSVSAEIGNLASGVEVEDTASATFRFNNGAIGSLIAGAHVSGASRDECLTIFGTEGQIRLPDAYSSDPLRIYLKQSYNQFSAGQWHSISLEPVPVYQRAIEDYTKAIQPGDCTSINAHAARKVLSVVLAIYQSSAEKRTIFIS